MFQLASAGQTLQTFFQGTANRLARKTGFVQRDSKVTGGHWIQMLTFGFLENPEASLNQLAQVSEDLGVPLTGQGVDERLTEAAVNFEKAMFRESLTLFRLQQSLPVEILERFTAVELPDSSVIALPDSLKDEFPGCGGDGPAASLKVQLPVELRAGRLAATPETGRSPDQTYVPTATILPGSLRISDLGYFNLQVFRQIDAHQAYFLSRLNLQTGVLDAETEQPFDLLAWLRAGPQARFEREVRPGASERLPVRLVAVRLPQAVADERRRKAKENARRKGRTLSPRYLALLDWNVFVTNVPQALLSIREVARLYRVRWQVELIFKVWKGEAQVDRVAGRRRERVLCELYAKLIGVVMTHLLSAPLRWVERELSLTKAYQVLQRLAIRLAQSLTDLGQLAQQLTLLQSRRLKFGLKDRRKTRLSTLAELRRPIEPCHKLA
jgi:hypothetical protein